MAAAAAAAPATPPMTATAGPELEQVTETYVKWIPDRPMTFEEFLDRFGEDDDVELVDGVPVEKMAAQLDHERLFAWLMTILNYFVTARDLGEVLGSRSAVQINNFRGRLPDLLFVRRDRDDFEDIVRQRAIYGAPDLVVEFVSPGDRSSDVVALETDYRAIGVAEIWFVDQRQQRVRVLRRQTDGAYVEAAHGAGPLASSVVAGFEIDVAWLWANPRPAVRDVIAGLLAGESGSESR